MRSTEADRRPIVGVGTDRDASGGNTEREFLHGVPVRGELGGPCLAARAGAAGTAPPPRTLPTRRSPLPATLKVVHTTLPFSRNARQSGFISSRRRILSPMKFFLCFSTNCASHQAKHGTSPNDRPRLETRPHLSILIKPSPGFPFAEPTVPGPTSGRANGDSAGGCPGRIGRDWHVRRKFAVYPRTPRKRMPLREDRTRRGGTRRYRVFTGSFRGGRESIHRIVTALPRMGAMSDMRSLQCGARCEPGMNT